jgi:phosphatidylserine/phosphatidylglycerophosphate/cardiolipin synthase-like enzyme
VKLSDLDQYVVHPPVKWPAGIRVLSVPIDEVRAAVSHCIGAARHSLFVAMFTVSDIALGHVLAQKATELGAGFGLATDATEAQGQHNQSVLALLPPGSYTVGTSEKGDYMHLKDAVIDSRFVLTGSTNWSVSGQTTEDNTLVVSDSPRLAAIYTARIQAVIAWQRAHPAPAPTPA